MPRWTIWSGKLKDAAVREVINYGVKPYQGDVKPEGMT